MMILIQDRFIITLVIGFYLIEAQAIYVNRQEVHIKKPAAMHSKAKFFIFA